MSDLHFKTTSIDKPNTFQKEKLLGFKWTRKSDASTRLKRNIKWSRWEDIKLIEYFGKYGNDWSGISKLFTDKTEKDIEERYIWKLSPNINKEKFTKEEDETIWKLQKIHGNKWTLISKHLNNRTQRMVKNRFYSKLKKSIVPDEGNQLEEQQGSLSYSKETWNNPTTNSFILNNTNNGQIIGMELKENPNEIFGNSPFDTNNEFIQYNQFDDSLFKSQFRETNEWNPFGNSLKKVHNNNNNNKYNNNNNNNNTNNNYNNNNKKNNKLNKINELLAKITNAKADILNRESNKQLCSTNYKSSTDNIYSKDSIVFKDCNDMEEDDVFPKINVFDHSMI